MLLSDQIKEYGINDAWDSSDMSIIFRSYSLLEGDKSRDLGLHFITYLGCVMYWLESFGSQHFNNRLVNTISKLLGCMEGGEISCELR